MGDDTSTLTDPTTGQRPRVPAAPHALALVVVWCSDQPEPLGEVLLPSRSWGVFGRGAGADSDAHPRLQLMQVRPGKVEVAPPLANPRLSRVQLRLKASGDDGVAFERLGQAPIFHGSHPEPVDRGCLRAGDTLRIGRHLLFLAVRRAAWLPELDVPAPGDHFPFGAPDAQGLVGESPAIWALRERLYFVARRSEHVLITGASGVGKELVARALHALGSSRALVARNAATFPEGLIDAELFGNARNYPNAGLPERPGLIGEADGSTLFLDEIGELPRGLHAHLLRVLDGGEYQRLGESRGRHSRFRLIAATNRSPAVLKEDLLARLPLRIDVPGLDRRREDVPLLARHLLGGILAGGGGLHARTTPPRQPRISLEFVAKLIRHDYSTNLRELQALLLESLSRRSGPELEWAPVEGAAAAPARDPGQPPGSPAAPPANPLDIHPAQLQAVLDGHRGSVELARRELGLSSRHALARLVTRHGLRAGRNWRPASKT